jgi:hypothetical protein
LFFHSGKEKAPFLCIFRPDPTALQPFGPRKAAYPIAFLVITYISDYKLLIGDFLQLQSSGTASGQPLKHPGEEASTTFG